jgi:uncharacterized membrane protein YfcA
MSYSAQDLALIGVIMTLGSFLQGALGFASGLVGVPLLVLSGFSLLEATVINFISTIVQNVAGAVQMWEHIEWRDVAWPTGFRALGMPVGMYALDQAQYLDQGLVKQIIGAFLLTSVLLLMFLRVHPRDEPPFSWTAAAFLSSGFLMGFGAIGGAPMVMYVNALTWSAPKCRGFLFFCSAALTPFMAVLLAWKFHQRAANPATAALLVMPAIVVALWMGLKLGHRLDKALFRRLTYALLILVSIFALVSPLLAKP